MLRSTDERRFVRSEGHGFSRAAKALNLLRFSRWGNCLLLQRM